MKKIYEAAYQQIVEIVNHICPNDPDHEDLIQDVALLIIEKPPELITKLYNKKQLKFYIAKIIKNNIFSSTSRYYYTYKKNKFINYDEVKEKIDYLASGFDEVY